MKYKLIIFDMDGTILNTLEDLADSLNYSLKVCGYPERTLTEVRSFVGNGIKKLIERSMPMDASGEDLENVYSTFMEYYALHSADKTRPYEGITRLLTELLLMGYKTAVVSNKADSAVKQLSQRYFPGLFELSIGERVGVDRKPSPDSVNEVMKQLDVQPEQTVYIGDSDVDIATARNAGIDSIIVEWGFRDRDFLIEKGAKVTVSTITDLMNLLKK